MPGEREDQPRIVVIGAGFAGLFAVRALGKVQADVMLVDRHNYHLFQPLLYQVATAGLSPSDIAWPIRSILRRQQNVTVTLAAVDGIDTVRRRVITSSGAIDYHYLVVATGARHAYFGHDDWEALAPGLKTIEDARLIRHRILMAFEQAENTGDEEQRRGLLRFVIVGAGPTGVELAGAIAALAHKTLARDFRHIDTRQTRIMLVEGGPRVLPTFSERSSQYAKRALERLGVEVRLDSFVTGCDENGVMLGDERIEAKTILWAAGVAPSPVAAWLGAECDRLGRALVSTDLSLPGQPDVFVIGDAASVRDASGATVPGVAQAAKQQGRYVARVIAARIGGRPAPGKFRYRNLGNLATIGRSAAVIEFPLVTVRGRLAWWLWGIAHIYFLLGVPSPLIVSIRWLWEYVTFKRGARLITEGKPQR